MNGMEAGREWNAESAGVAAGRHHVLTQLANTTRQTKWTTYRCQPANLPLRAENRPSLDTHMSCDGRTGTATMEVAEPLKPTLTR